jgi:adenylyl cyclase-associated protein
VDPAALAKLKALVERLEGDAKAKYGYVPPPAPAPSAAATAPRKGPGGPPPPPGPPPNLADLDDKRGGKKPVANAGALFAELNKGSDITVGLKKVTKQKAASSKVRLNHAASVALSSMLDLTLWV